MKVYAVHRCSGSYDDYHNWVHSVFAKKEVAEAFVEKKNAQIERLHAYSKPLADMDLDDEPNWHRHYSISETGKFWIKEFEVID